MFSDLWFDWENKISICILEIFIFFMISWLSNKKIGIVKYIVALSYQTLKKAIIIYVKLEN
jgi:hypothetical protein